MQLISESYAYMHAFCIQHIGYKNNIPKKSSKNRICQLQFIRFISYAELHTHTHTVIVWLVVSTVSFPLHSDCKDSREEFWPKWKRDYFFVIWMCMCICALASLQASYSLLWKMLHACILNTCRKFIYEWYRYDFSFCEYLPVSNMSMYGSFCLALNKNSGVHVWWFWLHEILQK